MQTITVRDVPETISEGTIIRILPNTDDRAFYHERVDRNIGWLTEEEQHMLFGSVVGIAGNGGMGGLLAAVLLRAGVGEIRITDNEVFDASNINRQFAARRATIGRSKVLETARELRRISDDATIVVYPGGINEETVEAFVSGCDLVFDEVEFFAVAARILLHQRARANGVPLINCNVVGFGTRLFLYTHAPGTATMEDQLGFTYAQAQEIEALAMQGDREAVELISERVIGGLVPEIPAYGGGDLDRVMQRLLSEGRASICATNPPQSTGFVANRALFFLLRQNGFVREGITPAPTMPGYLYFDAATMTAKVVEGAWWSW